MQDDKSDSRVEESKEIESNSGDNVGEEARRTESLVGHCQEEIEHSAQECRCGGMQEKGRDSEKSQDGLPAEYRHREEVCTGGDQEKRDQTDGTNPTTQDNTENEQECDWAEENAETVLRTRICFTDSDYFNRAEANEEFPYKNADIFAAMCECKKMKYTNRKSEGCVKKPKRSPICKFFGCCMKSKTCSGDEKIIMRMKQIELCLNEISGRVDKLIDLKKRGVRLCNRHGSSRSTCDASESEGACLSFEETSRNLPESILRKDTNDRDGSLKVVKGNSTSSNSKAVRIDPGMKCKRHNGYQGSDEYLNMIHVTSVDLLNDCNSTSLSEDYVRRLCDCGHSELEVYSSDDSLNNYSSSDGSYLGSRPSTKMTESNKCKSASHRA